jgi:hypothetical protein
LDKQDSKLDHIISLATTVSQAHRALRVEQQPPSKYATIPPEVQYRDPRRESTPARLARMTRYHVASAASKNDADTCVCVWAYLCGLRIELSRSRALKASRRVPYPNLGCMKDALLVVAWYKKPGHVTFCDCCIPW